MEFALLHSPFLSPSSSLPLANALRDRGAGARILSAKEAFEQDNADYASVADSIIRHLDGPCTLVAHSGAGGLVSSIAARAGESVRLAIFVDAILPHDGQSWFETAPGALVSMVRASAVEGRAPPWSDWFGDSVLRHLVPDEAERVRLTADLPRVRLAFLEQPAPPVADELPSTCCAYLQLSEDYAAEAAQAATLGWATRRLDGDHLWWVTHPAEVAEAILGVAASTV